MASLIKRETTYYAQHMVGQKAKRISLDTSSFQLAKEKLRQLESSLYRDEDNPLPTKTPLSKVVTEYVASMRSRKTAKSVQRNIYYLWETFGPIRSDLTLKKHQDQPEGQEAAFQPPSCICRGNLLRANHNGGFCQLHFNAGAPQGAGTQDRQPLPGSIDAVVQLGHDPKWHQDAWWQESRGQG